MRRFATWCTGHRKTVILSWIVALIGVGMIASSVGSDFSEDFKLPASDSTDAFDLLESKFPAQSGDTTTIVFEADSGVESQAVRKTMEGLFAEAEALPHVSEVASPYSGGGAAAISEDGKIAYATVQYDVFSEKIEKEDTAKLIDEAEAANGSGLQVDLGGQPVEEARAEEEGDASFMIGLLAAVVILLLTFGSVVAMGLPLVTALFALGVGLSLVTLGTHVFDTAEFAPQLAAMIGLGVGIDYALFILTRFRNGLDEGLESRDAAIAAVDTAGRAVLFAGVTVIIALMGMLLLGLSFLYGVAMAAAFAVLMTMIAALTLLPALLTIAGRRVDKLRIPGLKRAPSTAEDTRLVPLEPRDPAPARCLGPALRRPAARPLHPHPLAAPRLQRRRHRPSGNDDARGLRPARRRLRARLQRPLLDRRGAAQQRRRRRTHRAAPHPRRRRRRRRGDAGDAQPSAEHRRLSGLPDDLAAEREDN